MREHEIGPFLLDAGRLTLTHAGETVALGPKVVETLLALVERSGEVVSKDALLDRIWPEGFVEEANLTQNVYVLRKTFRNHGCSDPIETVPRRGYRLSIAVRPATISPHAPAAISTTVPATLRRRIALLTTVAACIVATVVSASSSGVSHADATHRALSAEGARLYQIGRYYWNLRTRDGVQKSLAFFSNVVDADPGDPRGYAALADANVTMGDYCYGTHLPVVYFARAREYAQQALALDSNSAEAHAALGFLALHRQDPKEAIGELRRAIALDPTYGPAHGWYGIALLRRGNMAEGLHHLKVAAQLDPLSVATTAWLGSAAYADRRFGDAILYSRQALELAPQRTDALTTIGKAYEARGEIDRAIAAFKRFGAVNPYYRPAAAALLARAYALEHRMPEAKAAFTFARSHASDVSLMDLVGAATALGDRESALQMLRQNVGHVSSMSIENAAHIDAFASVRS